jgi:hypothetical protein
MRTSEIETRDGAALSSLLSVSRKIFLLELPSFLSASLKF